MKTPHLVSIPNLFLLAIIICSASLFGCSSLQTTPSIAVVEANRDFDKRPVSVLIDENQKQEIGLKVIAVKQGIVYKTVEAPGRVGTNAELSRLVSTPSAGRVVDVAAKLGDTVKAGQVMAIIKSDPIGQVQSDLLQSTLQAKADIKQQEVQMKLSRITFERESKLFAEQVSAKADLQTAENQLEKDTANLSALKAKLEATIRVAQERLSLLGAPPDSARRVIAQSKIDPLVVVRAPEAGLVIERTINPGELTDGSKELFTLTDLSHVWLFADVFEKDVHDVKKDQEAVVSVDSFPDRTFPAEIIWVGDSINSTTRTLPVRANVNNADLLLRPGMFARLKIGVGQISVLLVPRSAIVQKGDRTLVFIETGNENYEERDVQTGVSDADDMEVKSGLHLGERVVTHGGTALLGTAMKTAEGRGD